MRAEWHLVKNTGKRQYRCTICGRIGEWSGSWSWYGSLLDAEEGLPVTISCSNECLAEYKSRQDLIDPCARAALECGNGGQ